MTEVNHHANTIHLTDNICSEFAYTSMFSIIAGRSQSGNTPVSVEIRSYAYVLYPHDLYHVVEVIDCIYDGSLSLFLEEPIVECHLCHTSCLCQPAHLVIRQVAWMVA